MNESKKIIIDTDIGDDIDDALAIALALHAPELEILGITTVFRNVDMRAKQVKALLTSYGRNDIPVCKGEGIPLSKREQFGEMIWEDTKITNCQYYPEIDKCTYEPEEGVDFIIRMVRQYPGDVTIVPIGALTNVAIAMHQAPDIIPLIKEVRLMGGAYYKNLAEWNILCDPCAANIVYTSGVPIYAVGLDVTEQCPTSRDDIESYLIKENPESKVLQKLLKLWLDFTGLDRPILHDPLTVCTLINNEVVTFEPKYIKVLLEDEQAGVTKVMNSDDERTGKIEVAIDVKAKEFIKYFTKTVLI